MVPTATDVGRLALVKGAMAEQLKVKQVAQVTPRELKFQPGLGT